MRAIYNRISNDLLSVFFFALYIIVALATFRHSSIGFASIESGSIFWGAMSALAVDIGMMLSATGLRTRKKTRSLTVSLLVGLIVSAGASIYTQLLFAVLHAQPIYPAAGAEWMNDFALWLIQRRILIMPALLPVLCIVYSFSVKESEEIQVKFQTTKAYSSSKTKIEQCIDFFKTSPEATLQHAADLIGCSVQTASTAKHRLDGPLMKKDD